MTIWFCTIETIEAILEVIEIISMIFVTSRLLSHRNIFRTYSEIFNRTQATLNLCPFFEILSVSVPYYGKNGKKKIILAYGNDAQWNRRSQNEKKIFFFCSWGQALRKKNLATLQNLGQKLVAGLTILIFFLFYIVPKTNS